MYSAGQKRGLQKSFEIFSTHGSYVNDNNHSVAFSCSAFWAHSLWAGWILQDCSVLPPHSSSSSSSLPERWRNRSFCSEPLTLSVQALPPSSSPNRSIHLLHGGRNWFPQSVWSRAEACPVTHIAWEAAQAAEATEAAAFRPATACSAWTACTKIFSPTHKTKLFPCPLCADWARLSADEQVAI